jgi:hypothetical protein
MGMFASTKICPPRVEGGMNGDESPAPAKSSLRFKIALLCILWAATVFVLGYLAGDSRKPVVSPGSLSNSDDLVVVNGCVVTSCQMLASIRAHEKLNQGFWSRVMLVKYAHLRAGHAYCVWETDGQIIGYDRNGGAFPVPVKEREPKAIAQALAGELEKVMKQPLAVERAEFIKPETVKIRRF